VSAVSAARVSAARVVHQVAAWCLNYPDEGLIERFPTLQAAVAELPQGKARANLDELLDYLGETPLPALQQHYVKTFDLSRKHALYLSYWTDGDTRRRGQVLANLKARYRASGWLVNTHGELTDYLPIVLEYAALADPEDGLRLLQEYRPSLELLRFALLDAGSPYARAVEAVCATLPGPSPADRAAVHRMAAAGPPREDVGLEPYDPRLLPLAHGSDATGGTR
jgi:nitrate reductase molybdenum cofactor assembly chaperone NarJ/NarW